MDQEWPRQRPLLEFIAAQPGTGFWVCEDENELVGYVRVARFTGMDELTEIAVAPSHAGAGIGKGLLERAWPEPPTPQRGRVVVTLGTPADLTLYTRFGVMPVAGHWHLRLRAEEYLERRSLETDSTEPGVHVLTPDRAVEEWKRLEPLAIGHERPALHEFFARTRGCLAVLDGSREGQGALLDEPRRGHRAGGGGHPRGSASPWCWPHSIAWPSRTSRSCSACTARPTPGICSTACAGSGSGSTGRAG